LSPRRSLALLEVDALDYMVSKCKVTCFLLSCPEKAPDKLYTVCKLLVHDMEDDHKSVLGVHVSIRGYLIGPKQSQHPNPEPTGIAAPSYIKSVSMIHRGGSSCVPIFSEGLALVELVRLGEQLSLDGCDGCAHGNAALLHLEELLVHLVEKSPSTSAGLFRVGAGQPDGAARGDGERASCHDDSAGNVCQIIDWANSMEGAGLTNFGLVEMLLRVRWLSFWGRGRFARMEAGACCTRLDDGQSLLFTFARPGNECVGLPKRRCSV
jgi:hypothetical protein